MGKVTIIGATSPLGVSLVPAYVAAGWNVAATYRNPAAIPVDWNEDDAVEPVELDLRSGPAVSLSDSEAIIWLAHLECRPGDSEPELNRDALLKFLGSLDAALVRSFVFISSGGSVYGHPQRLPITEDHPREPLSAYGQAKKMMEDEITGFGERTGIRTAILRPGNIYGFERPDRKCKDVTAAFLNALDKGLPFTLVHGGRTIRDFVHVDDVCRAIIQAAGSGENSAILNVGTSVGTSTLEWIEALRAEAGAPMPTVVDRENSSSDVLENVLSHRHITETLGWQPSVSLTEGARRTVAHWRAHGDASVPAAMSSVGP